ncbi:MAG: sigma-70 family RNA polymerase sigma factor [Puniceicoccales bacterium]|jgi:RNA polymerase sigma-70 factor (ECF subfamily)|nr:sigma-70 family RNA polymerase sigma factor [Puniceicoccales bacterium]
MIHLTANSRPPAGMVFDAALPTTAGGGGAWFEQLVRAHQAALLAYARSLTRDHEAARDITQDTFLRCWKNRPDPEFARAWLFRVCRSRAVDWWRRRREFTVGGSPDAGGTAGAGDSAPDSDFFERLPDDSAGTPADALVRDEAAAAVLRAVAQLPPRQRELVRLKFQAGFSYKEIAAATGLTVTNVGFILHTAVAALRKLYEHEHE